MTTSNLIDAIHADITRARDVADRAHTRGAVSREEALELLTLLRRATACAQALDDLLVGIKPPKVGP